MLKISAAEMNALREAAEIQGSISGQVDRIRLGRAVERDPRFEDVKIEEALKGLRPVSSLTDEQQEAFLDRLSEAMREPTGADFSFWEDRRQRGLGIGTDEAGSITDDETIRSN